MFAKSATVCYIFQPLATIINGLPIIRGVRLPTFGGRGFRLVELEIFALGYVSLGRPLVEPSSAARTLHVVGVF